MIKVDTIEEFQKFLQIVKSKSLTYAIVGNEEESFVGMHSGFSEPKPNSFCFQYVLNCSIFTVLLESHVSLNEKEHITSISSNFNFTPFKNIYYKDGVIHCYD